MWDKVQKVLDISPLSLYNGYYMMKKGKKMATEWKKPIEKVKSLYSEKELIKMSFKEYWALGLTPTWSPVRSK